MKTSLVFLLTVLSVGSFATVRTVSNDPTRPAQYTTFTNAQTASSAGDTIYLYGSAFNYPALTIQKRLVIIGAGYAPNNQFGQPTRVDAITLFRDSGSNDASGTVLTGLLIVGRIDLGGTLVSNNVTIYRNYINSYINLSGASPTGYVSGWTIYNNIIDSYIYGGGTSRTSSSATNIIIANNIFTNSSYLHAFNSNTILVDHNLFIGNGSNKLHALFNVIVTNNIFIRSSNNIFTNVVFCTFNKNLSNQSTIGSASEYSPTTIFEATFIGSGGGSNSGSGNIVGADPLFVNVTNVDAYNQNFNYRLQASSPGRNAGSDGTDLGIYGGSYPFPSGGVGTQYDTAPMPPIPQVTTVNIQNATIAPNGTLNVQVQGRVNN